MALRVGRGAGGERDVAAGLDDPVERAAVDDQVLDDRERARRATARRRSSSPSRKCAHVQLAGRWSRCRGPWATPLITSAHAPQMPSRQSWSKAIGSSPPWMSCSLRTSSISRNDMSGEMSSTS